MATRIGEVPVYASRTDQIPSSIYNAWRRARINLQLPLRIEMPDLKSLAVIVENDRWVLVDPRQYDLPILAWIDFQDRGRLSLHTPVACTVNYYHYMASQLRLPTLQYIESHLQKLLRQKKRF